MDKEIELSEYRDEFITPSRLDKIRQLVSKRQHLSVVLENVHDPHNIGAVLRSCDAVGVGDVYMLYTEPMHDYHRSEIGNKASSGARKWVKAHYYYDVEECFYALRQRFQYIYGTHLGTASVSVYDLDLTGPVALMFGNEHLGISTASLDRLDGNFIIPQYGMVQSLNISVACAVSLFEALRQREGKGMYDHSFDEQNPQQQETYRQLVNRHIHHVHQR